MTLDQWQKSEVLTAYVQSLLSQPNFSELLRMLRDSHIKNYRPMDDVELQATSHILKLGKIYGYDECLETIEKAAFYRKEVELIPTFDPPEEPKQ